MGILKAALAAGALAGLGTAAVKNVQNKTFCPVCAVKKFTSAASLHIPQDDVYNSGAALTPPMGWSSWNTFRNTISEELILEIANAMKVTGLLDAGYRYVNLDDCWQSSMRTADGRMQGDLSRFPGGIKKLVGELNELGFKAGIYSSNGTLTCEDLPASLGREAIDAQTFVEWGFEYLKYDFCHNSAIPTAAPFIEKISLAYPGMHEHTELSADSGELYGTARVVKNEKLSCGTYVAGLGSNNGKLRFSHIEVEQEGDYTLTIGLKKSGLWNKFLTVTVNDCDEYELIIPSTKGVTADGRAQLIIHLNAGNNTLEFKNPVGSRMDSSFRQYRLMGRELKRAAQEYAQKNNTPLKPVCFSICEWGFNRPWVWGAKAGNLWRTTLDIMPNWGSIVTIYEFNVRLYKHAAPGSWNDPDMLEVGNGSLTVEENRAHFSLWCMMAAPLILGNDLRSFLNEDGSAKSDDKILKILTDSELIAIDQDERGAQCKRIKTNGVTDILAKPLKDGELAVCMFNKSGSDKQMSFTFEQLHNDSYIDLPRAPMYLVRDLWDKNTVTATQSVSANVPSHGVKVYRIKAAGLDA